MAFVSVPNTLQVETIFELSGQVVENTCYFESITPAFWNEATITGWLDDMRVFIESQLMPSLSTAITLVRLVGTLLDAVDSIAVTLSVSPGFPGSVVGDPYPNNVSYCISFLTNQRGRSFRGRNYVAGFGDPMIAGNIINANTRTALLAYYTGLRALASDGAGTMVVVSRFANGVPRVVGVTTPITGFTTFDNIVDSQRRRLPGRGN